MLGRPSQTLTLNATKRLFQLYNDTVQKCYTPLHLHYGLWIGKQRSRTWIAKQVCFSAQPRWRSSLVRQRKHLPDKYDNRSIIPHYVMWGSRKTYCDGLANKNDIMKDFLPLSMVSSIEARSSLVEGDEGLYPV